MEVRYGQKANLDRKHVYFCIASLIFLSFSACTIFEKTNVKIIGEEKAGQSPQYGEEPIVQEDDKGAPKKSRRPSPCPLKKLQRTKFSLTRDSSMFSLELPKKIMHNPFIFLES